MISIIICSRTQTLNKDLSENIKKTVGCEHELIVIDNSENQYSIFEAYNLGIEKSTNDYLCFIHDDVLFHSDGWGYIIQQIFNENIKIGLIGVAGAKIKTRMPSAWWDCHKDQLVLNIIQHFGNGKIKKHYLGFKNNSMQEVVSIDGVFMAMRKDNRIRFNLEMKGFHGYDLNISFEYKKYGFDIVVTNKILLEHFSLGEISKKWIQAIYKIHGFYKKEMPFPVSGTKVSKDDEIINAQQFINKSLLFGFKKIAVSVWVQLFLLKPFSKYNYRFWRIILRKL